MIFTNDVMVLVRALQRLRLFVPSILRAAETKMAAAETKVVDMATVVAAAPDNHVEKRPAEDESKIKEPEAKKIKTEIKTEV